MVTIVSNTSVVKCSRIVSEGATIGGGMDRGEIMGGTEEICTVKDMEQINTVTTGTMIGESSFNSHNPVELRLEHHYVCSTEYVFFSNSALDASEFLEKILKIFPLYYMHSNVCGW